MTSGLSQAQQRFEGGHDIATGAQSIDDGANGRGANAVVDRAFFGREFAVEDDLRERRQIRRNFFLESTQQEGADSLSQARRNVAVALGVRSGITLLELRSSA